MRATDRNKCTLQAVAKASPPAPAASRILGDCDARKLLRVVEIAEILRVSKQRADQLRHEPDFPAPVDRWARWDL